MNLPRPLVIVSVIAITVAAGGVGYWTAAQHFSGITPKPAPQEQERKPAFYRNPMNPSITSPVPAKDSMGMDYIPVYADPANTAATPQGTVTIDPVFVQNIGVRTVAAARQTLSRMIRTVGRVTYAEHRIAHIHPKVEGWVEALFIAETGTEVTRGTILLDIYSPQLVTSEQEFLLALKSAETLRNSGFEDIREGAAQLLASARERLKLLDVPDHQIRELEQTGVVKKALHIHSPLDGIVVNIGVRHGQLVTPETELYQLADLSRVWILADVYEDELPWVKQDDMARIRVTGIPGTTFEDRIAYIYPYLDSRTRTVKVRIELDNPERALKPDMFADVEIFADARLDAIVVPSEAIVRSGPRSQVFIARGAGRFDPREVETGISADGLTQIVSGVQPGEEVVTSSQFLIDSESKLREATAKMLQSQKPAADHGANHD